jgi:hypothetical protein
MPRRFILTALLTISLLGGMLPLSGRIRLALPPDQGVMESLPPDSGLLIITATSWQAIMEERTPSLPPRDQTIALQILLPARSQPFPDEELDIFQRFLQGSPQIDSVILQLTSPLPPADQLGHQLKQITSLIRGVSSTLAIGLEADDPQTLIAPVTDQQLSVYIDALVIRSGDDQLAEQIMLRLPQLKLWERLNLKSGSLAGPGELITGLFARPLFMSNTTSLYLCDPPATADRVRPLIRLMPMLQAGLIDRMDTVKLKDEKGGHRILPLYFRHDGVSPVILVVVENGGKKEIQLSPGVYDGARITDLDSGAQNSEKIGRHAHSIRLALTPSIYLIELTPRERLRRQVIQLGVMGESPLSADEIVAQARGWMAVQSRKLLSFIADMSVTYSLRVGNLNETFDLMIRGPYFSARGEPFDWVQRDFYLNNIKWKSRKPPKIPLLQPEKVGIVPLEIELSEQYRYQRGRDDRISDVPVFTIHFKPGPGLGDKATFSGRLWIRKKDGAVLRKELTQLNLKGEVVSNVETQTLSPLGQNGDTWLTTRVVGHQIFNIAGVPTHVEKHIRFENIRLNPPDFSLQRQAALDSDARMVRDTKEGMRYLVKDKDTGDRKVEWKQSKTQTAAIFGTFYDSSFAFPVPLAGINYLNFDIGGQGKGRQTNILFGGAMLMANYTDPSLLGSKISFSANFSGIAFASRNKVFRNLILCPGETIREQILKGHISFGLSLSPVLKVSAYLFADATFFSAHPEETSEAFIMPQDHLNYGIKLKADANFKGTSLSWWGEYGLRSAWDFWGLPGQSDYMENQRSFFRWRFILGKDFHIALFRKLQTKLTWLSGQRLDRFSAYKFGFFSELRVSGFSSGTIRAEQALMLNLAYTYQLGQSFCLEFKYDSILVGNKQEKSRRRYFSGLALAASTALPVWDGMLLKLEAGIPVVSHGIRGFVLNLMLLKMF